MAKRVSVDGWLFTVTLILVFLGLVMVFSASAVMAKERYGSGYFFLLRQVGWAAGGIIAMAAAMKIDYRRYKHPAVVFSVLGVTTLLLISVFFLDRFVEPSPTIRGILIPTIRSSQSSDNPFPRVFSRESHQVHG